MSMPRFLFLLLLLFLTTGCVLQAGRGEFLPGGDPELGEEAILAYGCGACHVIPGIPGANATVGPTLEAWPERAFIAGTLPNSPENVALWIRNPQAIEPATAMPNLDVTEEDSRNIAAYLYHLR